MKNSTELYKTSSFDFVLIALFLILVIIGYLNLYSSDLILGRITTDFWQTDKGKQLIFIIISMFLFVFMFFVDSYIISFFSWPVYIFSVILLILVLIFGQVQNGAKSWFGIAGLGIQPAELAKLGVIMALARYVNAKKVDFSKLQVKDLLVVSSVVFVPIFLIILQPDLGTILSYSALLLVFFRFGMSFLVLFFTIFSVIILILTVYVDHSMILSLFIISFVIVALLFTSQKKVLRPLFLTILVFSIVSVVANVYFLKIDWFNILTIISVVMIILSFYIFYRNKEKFVIKPFLIAIALFMLFIASDYIYNNILKEYHLNRIKVIFDEKIDPAGIGYHLRNSKIAISSGGLIGKGYLQGVQTKLKYIPEHNTDFIFCNLAEEWGFFGVSVYFILFLIFIIKIINAAERQVSYYSKFFGYATASFLFVHFFLNIAMTVGLFPVIGLPLPFFSYGGSAFLIFSAMVIIFIRLDSQRNLNI